MPLYDLPEMKSRLAALDAERQALAALVAAAEAYEGRVSVAAPKVAKQPPAYGGGATTVLQMTEEVALKEIEKTGLPVQTRDVIALMRDRGLPLPPKNVINVVSARLSNSGRLVGRRGFGWWPKGEPWPDERSALNFSGGSETAPVNENGEAEASPETGESDLSNQ